MTSLKKYRLLIMCMFQTLKTVAGFYIFFRQSVLYMHLLISLITWLFFAGKGDYPKLLSVSPCGQTWVEHRVVMDQQWSDLVNEWCLCHPARKLRNLQVDTTLLQERSCHSWSHARGLTTKQVRGLLPWWSSFCLGYRPFQVILLLWN